VIRDGIREGYADLIPADVLGGDTKGPDLHGIAGLM